MAAAELLLGLAAAIAVSRILSGFLFGLSPFDPATWGAALVAFSAVVLVACWIPAQRAAAIDPAANLRVE